MQVLLEEFRQLPDYRKNKVRYTHPGEILFLSLLALLSGAGSYEDIATWMKERKRELSKFLGRAFKAPAYTTIRNTFLGIDTQAVEKMQQKWIHQLSNTPKDSQTLTIVATDGKTMRGSANKEMSEKARHIVSLFLTESKLTLAQAQVQEKTNEIPALVELLDALNLTNCVITMDAMHTQKKH
ncbi:ISAs1 family transposase [Sulfurimonas hydrogeniphila]|uniref:ISAs1 family transposase n=1 Tax=Sulfurimonas hydrogeniphila TaxID=2509341 RepID=UPI00125F975F|nr:ISAs1 family transposase [Sulfurimonas hydrogeniphila]